jgi:hypothetical protein
VKTTKDGTPSFVFIIVSDFVVTICLLEIYLAITLQQYADEPLQTNKCQMPQIRSSLKRYLPLGS